MAYNSEINDFFEIYARLAKRYELSYQMSFGAKKDVIRIFQGENKRQIVRVETDDAVECWEKATESLTGWAQGKA